MTVKVKDSNTQQAQAMETGNQARIRIPIATKLALAITLLIVSGMSTLGFTILENQKTVLSQQIHDMGSAIARQFANSSTDMVLADDSLGLQTLINNLVDNQQIKGAIIISDKGHIVVSTGAVPSLDIIENNVIKKSAAMAFEWKPNQESNYKLICFNNPIIFTQLIAGNVIVTFSKQRMDQSLQKSRFIIIMITALMSLIAMLIAFIMSRHLSKPIYNLVDASKAIGDGNYRFRLSERRNDEIGELACAFNQMAKGLLQKTQVEDAFSKYVSSNVAQEVLANLEQVELGGKHVHASVLFADIVGFTSISEQLPPEEITKILNEYFSIIAKIAKKHNGHIDKFMGDCAMLVFGVPDYSKEHSYNAAACAVMIRDTVQQLNQRRIKQNKIPIHFKIGINTGVMVAGNLGSNDRMEYTVIGDPVNLASRLAGIAGSGEIIILEEFYKQEQIQQRIIAHKNEVIKVRGKREAVTTWTIENLEEDFRRNMKKDINDVLNTTDH
ncbi:Adenylate cyclase [hydrothermal vent metagenome]|uniref:Adenylate cyclase n=1 Tax=hydrothermal vent metagenome TaxID=652676 RepID=A0A3B0XKX7_9ZZZZ